MLMKFARNGRLLAGVPFIDGFSDSHHDNVVKSDATAFYDSEELKSGTGWQRLRSLFRKHEEDPIHPAAIELMQNSMASFTVGGIYGAITASRNAFINFIERNEATQFRNHLDAKRKLSDTMILSYMKGFGKWGSKVCIFVTVFTATHLMLSVYRNKYAFWHYSAGGAAAGALYKFQLGPKGMLAGAVFGGLCGTLYGSWKVLMLTLTNRSEQDLMNFRQELKTMKDSFTTKAHKKADQSMQQEEMAKALLSFGKK